MAGSRRVPLVVAISIAAVVAVVASMTTCAPDDVAQAPSAERPTEMAARTPARPAPARTPRARATSDAEAVREKTSTTASPQAAAGGPTGRVRVTVTCDGVAIPDADVLLIEKPTKPATPRLQSSDGAYFDVPWYLGVTSRYATGLGASDANGAAMGSAHMGTKSADGSVTFDAPLGRACFVVANSGNERLVARTPVEVSPDASRTTDIEFDGRRAVKIAGRCIDADDKPVADAWVQAIDPNDEVPASPLVKTDASGAFALEVDGERPSYRVRAVASRTLPLCSAETEVVAIPADTTVSGVVAGGKPIEVRMARGRSVVLDVTGEVAFNHLQVEGLVYEPSANAWGRLGGPRFSRATSSDRAFAAVPWSDAERPLYVWSWTSPPSQAAVDPRGRDRVSLKLPLGRKVTVKGRGWLPTDRLRVVCRYSVAGAELPVIWIESEVGTLAEWSRPDAPPCEVEFRLVRDGREIGAASVAAGKDEAPAVRIDLSD